MSKAERPESTLPLSGSQWGDDPYYSLWVLLARTRDAVYRVRQKDLNESGLTAEQSFVLNTIQTLVNRGMAARVTPAEISRQMFRESQSVSELLHRMEREGLVSKVKDLQRKNMVRIEITKKGRERLEAGMNTASIPKIMSNLSARQREDLVTSLTVIRKAALEQLGVSDVPISIDFERPRKKRTAPHRSSGRNGRR